MQKIFYRMKLSIIREQNNKSFFIKSKTEINQFTFFVAGISCAKKVSFAEKQ